MTPPALRYLQLIHQRIDRIRADVPHFTSLGEKMARPLLACGALFTPNLGTYWPHEFGGRAGGFMGLKPPTYVPQSENDVAFTTLPDVRRWKPNDDGKWLALIESKAQIFLIAPE